LELVELLLMQIVVVVLVELQHLMLFHRQVVVEAVTTPLA
jgi:hypothetical protein